MARPICAIFDVGVCYRIEHLAPMTNPSDRLRRLLEHYLDATNMSQTALAKQMKIAPSAISRMLSGERQISAIELFSLKEIFQIPFLEFEKIFSVGIRDDIELITASYYHESETVLNNNRLIEHILRENEFIACPHALLQQFTNGFDNQVRWYQIVDDAMSPTLMKGDIALVDSRDIGGSGVYLMQFGDGSLTPRRLDGGRWTNDELLIYVSSDNIKYKSFHSPLMDLRIKGRIAGRMTTHV